jgi:hypothetical protein
MTAMSADLVAFLRARLDEEAARQQNSLDRWHHPDCENLPDGIHVTFGCNCGVPERVLASIEADRALLHAYEAAQKTVDAFTCPDMYDVGRAYGLEEAMQHRAVRYADHPEYREEWRP